ncbi:PIG-L family deacetylase [Methylomonas sp. AM2-LC]|uniref:PIG-L deacetylase family protein n=1 Tax=Methylomonas sp. AM2-LC TaxID=3153301 RepID=UPI00326529EB
MKISRFCKLITLTMTVILAMLCITVAQAQTPANFNVGHAERLLVLAPHPDDETLSAGGLIQQVLAQGGSVRSVVVTSGDAYVEAIQKATGKQHLKPSDFIHYGEDRLNESRHAAQLLGKGFIHLDLLGYSDGSVYAMLVSHWRRSHPDRSGFTGFDHVPYRAAEDKGIAQDGEDLRNELVAILKDTKPTIIVFPDVMENDSDHAGLGMFALLAVDDWRESNKTAHTEPRLLAYLIHWQDGWPPGSSADKAIDNSEQPLFLPEDLPLRGHSRSCLALNQPEVKLKSQALQLYKTQQQAMGPFLQAFVHSNECFTEFKVADSRGIENVVKQWQHARKQFDSHPVSRWRIARE